MRKDAKEKRAKTSNDLASVAGYHSSAESNGRYEGGDAYARHGFGESRFYTSDRYIRLDEHGLRTDNGMPPCGYGLEIELASRLPSTTVLAEVLTKVALAGLPQGIYKMQSDASLGGNSSAEVITQVMSRERVRNLYPVWRDIWKVYFPALLTSPDGSCGMHTNISRSAFGKTRETQEEAMRKLYWVVNRYGAAFAKFLKREHFTYCAPQPVPARHEELRRFSDGHMCAVNCAHWNEADGTARLELRLVGPQLSWGAFRNTMEFVFALVDGVKTASWRELEAGLDRAVLALFKGANQYVVDRLRTAGAGLAEETIRKLEDAQTNADYI